MKITELQTDFYRIPLPVALSDATHGKITHFDLITARVTTSDGNEGVGYTFTPGTGGAAIHALVNQDLRDVILGQDARRIEYLWDRMWWHVHFAGRGGALVFAISAIDIALWDLASKAANEPWWRFLGGHKNRVEAYAGGVDLHFTLDALMVQTAGFLDQGFNAIKMKVGQKKLSEDVERVAKIREVLGSDLPLMVDANMGWRVDEAIRGARALAEYNVYWLEEPTIPDNYAGHAKIAREGGVPIATGENLRTIYEFEHMIRYGEIAFPEPDVAICGGVTKWLKVAKLAEANNLPVTSHGVHDLHVHLLSAVPNASFLEVHMFGLEKYIHHPLEIEDGFAIAPDRPGHGVEFNWEAMKPHIIS
ncbi:MAG: mandelate racemase/muconate lactonizing enzyme family protein [Candidatus Latescibacterota bacterium]|nr:mandelate racemase/muconate lactonizing enzyme family protein [Candidatus Latescibacterota bacterium]